MGAGIIALITTILGGGLQIWATASQNKSIKAETEALKAQSAKETNELLYSLYLEQIAAKEQEQAAKEREKYITIGVVIAGFVLSGYLLFKKPKNKVEQP